MNPQQETVSTTREWFDAWLQAFGGEGDGIWTLPDPHSDLAIPYVRGQFVVGPLRLPILAGATNDHTPRFDILGELTQPASAFYTMMRDHGVSMLSFSYLSEHSRLLRAIKNDDSDLIYHVDFCEISPFINCTKDWDRYWQSRGKTKATWKRRERTLLNKYDAKFECVSDWARAVRILPEIFAVEASGWKGRQGSAIQQDPNTQSFYTMLAKQWANDGALRLFVLSIDKHIIAFQLNALYGGVLYHVKVGFLEDYASYSPGQALQLQILRWAFDNPDVRAFDLLGGGGRAAATKLKWATNAETLYTLYVFRKNLRGLVAWTRLVVAPAIKARILRRKSKESQELPYALK